MTKTRHIANEYGISIRQVKRWGLDRDMQPLSKQVLVNAMKREQGCSYAKSLAALGMVSRIRGCERGTL